MAERPRDALGRPLPLGSPTAIPFEDYAARPVSANFARGREHFAAGRFFEAHEAWEEAWRQARGTVEQDFFHGLAQLAAGYVHVGRGNARGALALFGRGLQRLDPYGPSHRGLALGDAVAAIRAQRDEAAAAVRESRPPVLLALPRL